MNIGDLVHILQNDFELPPEQRLMVEMLDKASKDIGLVVFKSKPIQYHHYFYANLVSASEWWFTESELITPRDCLISLPDMYYLPDGTITNETIHPEAKEIHYKTKVLEYVRNWILEKWTIEKLEEVLY